MKNLQILVLFFVTSFLTVSTSCAQKNWGSGITGEGSAVTENWDLSSFDGIALSVNADVYLTQGSSQSIKVSGQKNILDNIERNVKDDVWKIKFKERVKKHEELKIWITIPDLTKVAVAGSGDVKGENTFRDLGDLNLAVAGSGDINLSFEAGDVNTSISGSGDISLAGSAKSNNIAISGAGDISAFDLRTSSCNISIAGSGDCQVNASNNLDVTIAGSGDVVYVGSPKVTKKIAGSGGVRAR